MASVLHSPISGFFRLRALPSILIVAFLATSSWSAELTLAWSDNSNNETGFKVERSADGNAFSQIAVVGANSEAFTDTALDAGTEYWFRVRAYNGSGDSGYSNASSGTTAGSPPANTAPTIGSISNTTIPEDTTTGSIAFSVGDVESVDSDLSLVGSSSNTALVSVSAIVFGGSGSNRTVTVTPLPNQSGVVTITVSVSDGSLGASEAFTVTVNPVNDAPTIGNISNSTVIEGASTGPIAFAVSDPESASSSLSVSGTSSNTALVPLSGIVFGGGGGNRTVTVTPASGQTGSATITVAVSDGSLTDSDAFTLTVTAAPQGSFNYDLPSGGTVALTAQDIGIVGTTGGTSFDSNDGSFTVVAGGVDIWDNADGFHFLWHQVSGDFSVTARVDSLSNPHQYAKAGIMIRESLAPDSIHATANLNPTGSANFLYRLATSGTTSADSASVSPPAWLRLERSGGLVAASYSADGNTWTEIGQRTLGFSDTVYVGLAASAHTTSNTITALFSGYDVVLSGSPPVNTAPSISNLGNRTISEDGSSGSMAFLISDSETPAGSLALTASSSNVSLVPVGGIAFGGSGSNRTVTVTPAANQSGTVTVTVTVSDGDLSKSDSFVLTVSPVNDAPAIGNITDRTIGEDSSTGAIGFSVTDVDDTNSSLTLTGVSSDSALVPNSAIVFGGSSTNRTVTVTPAANQSGTVTVTVTVSDGDLSKSDSFVLTVTQGTAPVTVSMISPDAGDTFEVGETISGEAITSDISRTATVEFFQGSTRINTERQFPYTFNWTPSSSGTYQIKAIVTDTEGGTSESIPVSVTVNASGPEPVTVSLLAPSDGSQYPFGNIINVTGSVSDGSRVARVDLLIDGTKIGQDQFAPYVILWSGAESGAHTVQLRAVGTDGIEVLSASVSITVVPPPLTVTLVNPASDRDLESGRTIRLEAVPSEVSNTSKVEFLVDGQVVGSDPAAPYEIDWSSQSLGEYSVQARAYDLAGANVSTELVTLTITEVTSEPTVTLISPVASDRAVVDQAVTFETDVDAKGASLNRVEYLVDGIEVGQSKSAPFLIDWVPTASGEYSIVARAIISGAPNVNSSPVVVSVEDPAEGPVSGIYRGTVAAPGIGADLSEGVVSAAAEATFDGVFAIHLDDEGRLIFLGFDSILGIGFSGGPVDVEADGSFSVPVSIPADIAALGGLPESLTIKGRVTSKGLEGSVEGTDLLISGDRVSSSGSSEDAQGVYELMATRTADTRVLLIVGADGVAHLVRIQNGAVTGDEVAVAMDQWGAYLESSVLGLEIVIDPAGGSADGILDDGPILMGLRGDVTPVRRLENISTRGSLNGGEDVMITGFVVSGDQPKTVLIRAVGPGLAQFGVSQYMVDPVLELVGDSGLITSNAKWILGNFGGIMESVSTRIGAFALDPDSLDAALLVTVAPGRYSAVVRDAARRGGNVLIEVYDTSDLAGQDNELVNLSTRGAVGSGKSLIGGFVVTGNVPKRVLVRGVGPGLGAFGVADALDEAKLVLTQRVSGNDVVIGESTGWSSQSDADLIAEATISAGAFSLDPGTSDSALLVWLEPGVYTAEVQPGSTGLSGTALVEVYQVD